MGAPRIGGGQTEEREHGSLDAEEREAKEELGERGWTEKGGDEAWYDPQHRRIAREE